MPPVLPVNSLLAGIKRNMTLALLSKPITSPPPVPPRKKRDPNRSPKDSSFDSSLDLEAQSIEIKKNDFSTHLKKMKLKVDVPTQPNDV